MAKRTAKRDGGERLNALVAACRENSTACVLFHSAAAAKMGLTPVGEKALEVIDRFGRITPGQLAEETGLSGAAVTGLIDRLEEKQFVRRVRDTVDRRVVWVEPRAETTATFAAPFLEMQAVVERFYETATDEELAAVERFLAVTTAKLKELATQE
ncbi:MarR family winged helix-turn-helix transcriptional regulator [Fimbriiglobus ruber]|uniref:Transcriptional regulator, MarR family n=1 Tax=Fimbriiglobus ruber TaxID=1908690 RepID=A0A225DJZ6_9BACT|nr:MarR family transcriptional regulator [Fimbriiglobus ruber]OWK41692.1 Transcriptional regulator, MarR family [Fimbriiglobus ruber]